MANKQLEKLVYDIVMDLNKLFSIIIGSQALIGYYRLPNSTTF
jgi:hypothetical protein